MPDFRTLFGHTPTTVCDAPGRVNLIGEHTDYNGGYVLPMAIPQRMHVQLAPTSGTRVRAFSADVAVVEALAGYALGEERVTSSWLDYVQGVTSVLRQSGRALTGFDVALRSDVPLGSGLSSSAAFSVGLLRGLRSAFGFELDDVTLAQLAQRVECDFVGAPVGVMDPMASSLAGEREALFLDTRSLHYERIALPPEWEVLVINSGVTHQHSGGEYRQRREECERAAGALRVPLLRDLSEADLPRALALPEPLGRRVRHVVTEDARVLEAVGALRAQDAVRLGQLFNASHVSLRDDFQVSIPQLDLLVSLAQAEPDVYGARMTGGGFGGSIVALARKNEAARVAGSVCRTYAQRGGGHATVLVPPPPERTPA